VASGGEEFDRYTQELMDALGGRDPLAVLRQTLDDVRRKTDGVPADRLDRSPGPGEWSPRQVLGHFADNDLVWGVRVRMIVTQDRPRLIGYDQDAWTDRFGDLDGDPRDTLVRWTALRESNLRLWASLSPTEWERIGLHDERGELTVRRIVELLAGHDAVHLAQLERGLAPG